MIDELNDNVITYCKSHIIKSCSGCKLKEPCKRYNEHFDNTEERLKVVKEINSLEVS